MNVNNFKRISLRQNSFEAVVVVVVVVAVVLCSCRYCAAVVC